MWLHSSRGCTIKKDRCSNWTGSLVSRTSARVLWRREVGRAPVGFTRLREDILVAEGDRYTDTSVCSYRPATLHHIADICCHFSLACWRLFLLRSCSLCIEGVVRSRHWKICSRQSSSWSIMYVSYGIVTATIQKSRSGAEDQQSKSRKLCSISELFVGGARLFLLSIWIEALKASVQLAFHMFWFV